MADFFVDIRNLPAPSETLAMGQIQHVIPAPMYIVGDKCRFFINFVSRIQIYSPASIKFTGTWISSPQ